MHYNPAVFKQLCFLLTVNLYYSLILFLFCFFFFFSSFSLCIVYFNLRRMLSCHKDNLISLTSFQKSNLRVLNMCISLNQSSLFIIDLCIQNTVFPFLSFPFFFPSTIYAILSTVPNLIPLSFRILLIGCAIKIHSD